jgi:hypothetical protein
MWNKTPSLYFLQDGNGKQNIWDNFFNYNQCWFGKYRQMLVSILVWTLVSNNKPIGYDLNLVPT